MVEKDEIMQQIFLVTDETKNELVICGTCSWHGAIRELISQYTIKAHGFEMHFCPSCESSAPLILIFYSGGFQGARGIPAIPPALSWRIGSGESQF